MNDSYIKLTLNKVPQIDYDEITYDLFELGAQGVSEKLNFIQTSQQYDPEILPKEVTVLEAYFSIDEKEKIESILQSPSYQKFEANLFLEKNKDWLKEWKKHYKPFCVVNNTEENLWVYPSWEKENIQAEQEVVLVDPGLAFGTGTHATTNLCLKALSSLLKTAGHGFETALDMGAGTGILSVLISKRGVTSVTACEIDEMARDKCRENLELNNCSHIDVVGPDSLNMDSYDLVVANIIDGVLLKIKSDLVKRTKKKLVLSGILLENEEVLLREFLSEGLSLLNRAAQDEWVCLELIKNVRAY